MTLLFMEKLQRLFGKSDSSITQMLRTIFDPKLGEVPFLGN